MTAPLRSQTRCSEMPGLLSQRIARALAVLLLLAGPLAHAASSTKQASAARARQRKKAPPASAATAPEAVTPAPAVEAARFIVPEPTLPVAEAAPESPTGLATDAEAGPEEQRAPRLRVRLGGSSNWRSYCARPRVKACADFDVRLDPALAGTSVDQAASVYLGYALDVETLPLAHHDSWLRGLGAAVEYAHAFNRLGINRSAGSAATPTQTLTASDLTLGAALLYRYPFSIEDRGLRLPAHVGLRLGAQSHSFVLEGDEQLEFNTRRLYPVIGLETLLPLARRAQVEAGLQLLINPRPGTGLGSTEQRALERGSFGESVSSRGWSARLGLSGEVWGPFGYSARVQLTRYLDEYAGTGTLTGWSEGGAAEETFVAAHWAVTARY